MKALIFTFKKTIFYTLVFTLLCINKVLIRIIPFNKLMQLYTNTTHDIVMAEVDENKVKMIRHSITRFRKLLFWQPVCFEQSLTVLLLARLFKMPGCIYFGINKSDHGKMKAHAWTQIGRYWVSGEAIKDSFTVVYKVHYLPKNLLERL